MEGMREVEGTTSDRFSGQDLAQTFIGRDFDYAPELYTSHVTSKQSDIYQVGLITYFIRTGKLAISSADGALGQVREGLSRKVNFCFR
jgi:serine/threonine protein kinase